MASRPGPTRRTSRKAPIQPDDGSRLRTPHLGAPYLGAKDIRSENGRIRDHKIENCDTDDDALDDDALDDDTNDDLSADDESPVNMGMSMIHDLDDDQDAANRRPSLDLFDTRHSARVAFQTVLGMLHGFATTICIARSLAAGERELDLSGLHEAAGVLCARALDLRPEHGRQLVPRLRSVLEELDALHTTLAPSRPPARSTGAPIHD
jgi:hypothetical protein